MCLKYSKRRLCLLRNSTSSITMGTFFLYGSFNFHISCIGNFLFNSQISLFKSNRNMFFQGLSLRRLSRSSSSKTRSSKHSSKQISNISKIKTCSSSIETSKIKSTTSESSSTKSSFSIKIILLFLFFIRKNLICFINFLKFLLRSSTIRMVFYSSLSKGFFYFILRCIFSHSKYFIIILLRIKIHNN